MSQDPHALVGRQVAVSAPKRLALPERANGFALPALGGAAIAPRPHPHRCLILEGDDLGLLHAFNEGILSAHQHGILTSTCLRANGYAYEHAIHEVLPLCPRIGVGIHLCLNEADPVSDRRRVASLLDRHRCLRSGYRWLMELARSSDGLRQIECELRAQIEKVLGDGVSVDHLNSHQHVHMIPAIFRVTCRLAREYGISCVRLVRELPYTAGGWGKRCQPLTNSNFVKHVLLNYFAVINERSARRYGIGTGDYFIGVNYTAHMTLATIESGLNAVPCGSVEMLLHPAVGPDPRDEKFRNVPVIRYAAARQRRTELQALRLPALKNYLEAEGWKAMSYRAWADMQQDRQPAESRPDIPAPVHELCAGVQVRSPVWISEAQPDSRAFAELVIAQTKPGDRVLDVGTGSGIIAICLARAEREVTAVDLSHAAVRTARANARRNDVQFECHHSDLLSQVRGSFDVIAFNPPYNFCRDTFVMNIAKNLLRRVPWVRQQSGLAMPRTILRFHQGLIARLVQTAPLHLRPGGRILIHAYETEVDALRDALPEGTRVDLLRHAALDGHTVGLSIVPIPAAAAP